MASGSESEPIIYIMDDKSPLLRIVTVGDNTCKLIGGPVGFKLNISKIIGTDFQQVPAHLMELPLATNGSDGVVQVTDVKEYADRGGDPTRYALGVWIYRNNRQLYVDSPLPYASSSKQGQFLRVNSKGEWAAEEVGVLPTVNTNYEGRVAVVKDDGTWGVSSSPRIDKQYIVNYLIADGFGSTKIYSTNFEFDEMWDAISDVRRGMSKMCFTTTDRSIINIYSFYRVEPERETSSSPRFIIFWLDQYGKTKLKMHEDKTIEVVESDQANIILPSTPTASDSGKIPMVQEDGSWGLGEIPGSSGSVGGKKYTLLMDQYYTGMRYSIDIEFNELFSMVQRGEMPEIQVVVKHEGNDILGVGVVTDLALDDPQTILMKLRGGTMAYASDGTLTEYAND
jgi:hypothetical protein